MKNEWYYLFITLFVLYLFRGVLIEKSEAVKELEKQGYCEINITDYRLFNVGSLGCKDFDAVKFNVTALSPEKKKVDVFVCITWPGYKATIHTEKFEIKFRFKRSGFLLFPENSGR